MCPDPAMAAHTPTAHDAASCYRLAEWSEGLFSIDPRGRLVMQPGGAGQPGLDLYELVSDLARRDLRAPLLLRFSDILRRRIATLAEAFAQARAEFGYRGDYRAVYPIKVNQQRHVVEEVLRFGKPHGFGLEAGSKPELLAILALVDDDDTPIVCNGFKDAAFIEAVILATKLGRAIVPVVEKFSELRQIIAAAKRHDVRPRIGIRVKLSAEGAGRWQESGGSRSKFGLFASELLDAVELLRAEDMLDSFQMLHAHIGSQISDVRSLKGAVIELARVYVELRRMGAGLNTVDAGGGLGVDYDGSATANDSSTNYSLQEYANNIVFHVGQACDDAGVEHPTLITESGRAMVAHHSVLIFNVLGWSGFDHFEAPTDLTPDQLAELPLPVRTLYESYHGVNADNFTEYFHDAQLNRAETLSAFSLGYCRLEHRALAERLFYGLASRVNAIAKTLPAVPDEFAHLDAMLADTYFCNGSIFQSLPDHWAIGQLFPVMPIHRLNEPPTCRGVLADITCDSDGKIDRFIGEGAPTPVLPLHPYTGAPYYLGVFLVGAYQEILGDLHNLFGDTNAVHISIADDGSPVIEEVVEGDSVAEVLSYVQFDPDQLRRSVRQTLERAVRDGRLTIEESQVLRRFYDQGLAGSTYLD